MFSKTCEYAIRSALYIAIRSADGTKLNIQEIAREIDSPQPFTAKILQILVREGIISSVKGPNGGFFLKPKSKPILLNSIVRAIDKVDILQTCVLGLKECSDKFPCPVHHEIKPSKYKLRDILRGKSIQELAEEYAKGKTYLKNFKS
ncbi:MAG: Rrf2 family transcriptional regulator [Bacteroidetes bacterium]|nr:Rrf2 family transcriptional regulator [Bacteroidota bacterium]MBS1539634.1 Rrf2 family transcriptional regulator [Bacteroidota bacterium]